jgi:hypothetical protein
MIAAAAALHAAGPAGVAAALAGLLATSADAISTTLDATSAASSVPPATPPTSEPHSQMTDDHYSGSPPGLGHNSSSTQAMDGQQHATTAASQMALLKGKLVAVNPADTNTTMQLSKDRYISDNGGNAFATGSPPPCIDCGNAAAVSASVVGAAVGGTVAALTLVAWGVVQYRRRRMEASLLLPTHGSMYAAAGPAANDSLQQSSAGLVLDVRGAQI